MVIFRSKQKKFEGDLKIRLYGKKRLYPTESVKHLGDSNLSWQYHVKDFPSNGIEKMLSCSK